MNNKNAGTGIKNAGAGNKNAGAGNKNASAGSKNAPAFDFKYEDGRGSGEHTALDFFTHLF